MISYQTREKYVMRQAQRTFTLEFKREAVRWLETSGKSGIQIAKDLGISDTILYRWRKEMRANGNTAFQPQRASNGMERRSASLAPRSRSPAPGAGYSQEGRRYFLGTARGEIAIHR